MRTKDLLLIAITLASLSPILEDLDSVRSTVAYAWHAGDLSDEDEVSLTELIDKLSPSDESLADKATMASYYDQFGTR